MEYKLLCFGTYSKKCFNCLIKCPDKTICENETIFNKIQKQLAKEENKNEENENKQR